MIEITVEMLKAFLQAIMSGGLAGLMGYMKQEELGTSWKVIFTRKFWEKFEPTKALKTMLISVIVYGISFYFGVKPATTFEEVGVMTLIVYGVDALMKFIVRRTPIVSGWNWLKEKALEIFK